MLLVIIFVRGWFDPRAIVRSEGSCQWKIPMPPTRIKPVTFRFVVQHLNHFATAVTIFKYTLKKELPYCSEMSVTFYLTILRCMPPIPNLFVHNNIFIFLPPLPPPPLPLLQWHYSPVRTFTSLLYLSQSALLFNLFYKFLISQLFHSKLISSSH
jgi:hypothetical protein